MTDGMKWFLIGFVCFFILVVFLAYCASRTPESKSDYDLAKESCNGKLAYFHYHYNMNSELNTPEFGCK